MFFTFQLVLILLPDGGSVMIKNGVLNTGSAVLWSIWTLGNEFCFWEEPGQAWMQF
jgi:hypothetical protein